MLWPVRGAGSVRTAEARAWPLRAILTVLTALLALPPCWKWSPCSTHAAGTGWPSQALSALPWHMPLVARGSLQADFPGKSSVHSPWRTQGRRSPFLVPGAMAGLLGPAFWALQLMKRHNEHSERLPITREQLACDMHFLKYRKASKETISFYFFIMEKL